MPESSSSPLVITVESAPDAVTLRVSGEIDIETCPQFAEALESATARSDVHLDLAEVEYMDSSGLRVLLVAKAAADAAGTTLDVTAASGIVGRLFDITGLAELLAPPV